MASADIRGSRNESLVIVQTTVLKFSELLQMWSILSHRMEADLIIRSEYFSFISPPESFMLNSKQLEPIFGIDDG